METSHNSDRSQHIETFRLRNVRNFWHSMVEKSRKAWV